MSKEKLVVMMGLPGVGKSEISERVARETLARRLNTDVVRKEICPEPTYSKEESAWIYQTMLGMAERLLDEGCNVVLDGTFKNQAERDLLKELAEKKEAVFRIIEVVCSDEELLRNRIEARKGTGNASSADWEVYKLVKDQFAPVTEECLRVDNIVNSLEELGELVREIVQFVEKEE